MSPHTAPGPAHAFSSDKHYWIRHARQQGCCQRAVPTRTFPGENNLSIPIGCVPFFQIPRFGEISVSHEIVHFLFGFTLNFAVEISSAVDLDIEDAGKNFRSLDLPSDGVAGLAGRQLGKFPKTVDKVSATDGDFPGEKPG